MAIASKLKQYLDTNGVKYRVCTHSEAYTAQEIAAAAHVPGAELAKTVIVRKGKELIMIVLPAPYNVDFFELTQELKGNVELASEEEFRSRFPDCELGAMPPFGNLYGVPVYVDEKLGRDREIDFNAGTHREVIRMRYQDFDRLVQPKHLKCATRFMDHTGVRR